MPVNKLIFEDAEKARDAITASQKKEIAKLYENWAAEIGERAKYYSHKSAPSYAVAERQMKELMKQMEATSHEIANEVYTCVKKNIYLVADSVVQQNVEWLKSLGFAGDTLDAAFNYVPDEIVRNIITGQIYDSGWSLSKRIWSDNEDTMKTAYQIVAGDMAQNKSIYEIAKDLESYVEPGAKKPWNLTMKDGRKIYPKQVDYNAQRLARTLVQHGYQQSFKATTEKNPFIEAYKWNANGSRVCDLCMERETMNKYGLGHGIYPKDKMPMDHPNGMCTMEPVVVDNLVDQLADWFNNPDGTYPEIDAFVGNFGYEAIIVTKDTLLNNQIRWEQMLSNEEKDSIKAFTGYSYSGVNSYVGGDDRFATEDIIDIARNVESALKKSTVVEPIAVERGTDLREIVSLFANEEKRISRYEEADKLKSLIGKEVESKRFVSTSYGEVLPQYNKGVVIHYNLKEGIEAANVTGISQQGNAEREILINRGNSMRITNIEVNEDEEGYISGVVNVFIDVFKKKINLVK